jgi:hypothetical protein
LSLQDFGDVPNGSKTESEPLPLLCGHSLSLLNRLPPVARCGKGIDRSSSTLSIDPEELFKIRNFASDSHAITQRIDDVRLLRDIRIRTEQCRQGIVFLKVVHEEFAKIAPVKAR